MKTVFWVISITLFATCLSCRKIDNYEKNIKPFIGKWTIDELVLSEYATGNPDSPSRRVWNNAGIMDIQLDPDKREWNRVFFTDSLLQYISWFNDMETAVGRSSFSGLLYTYVYSDYDRLRLFFWGISSAGTITKVVNVQQLSDKAITLYYPQADASGTLTKTCIMKLKKQ